MIKTVFSKYLNWKHQKICQSEGEKMVNKKNWLGMLAMVLALGLALSGCVTEGSDDLDDTETRAFPENMIGSWSKSDGLTISLRNAEPSASINVVNGRLSIVAPGVTPAAFIVAEISGSSYKLGSTTEGGRYYQGLIFTAIVGADGKLTISGAEEFVRGEDATLSNFDGVAVSVINGTYTKK
jgi:hypothetical protein